MIIKPLNIPLEPIKPIKKPPSLMDRCASIAKSLFPLIGLLVTASLLIKKVIPPAFFYSITFVSTTSFLSLICLTAITAALAAYILKSSTTASEEACIIKDEFCEYKSNIKTIPNFSEELNHLNVSEEEINQDLRYSCYVTYNLKKLENCQKGWARELSDLLKEEGFPQEKIHNVLKSIEIQIFDCVLKKIRTFIESKNHFSVAILDNRSKKTMDIQTQVTFLKGSKNCLIELKKGMNLYKAILQTGPDHVEYKMPDIEAPLGSIFFKITASISKDLDQMDQLSYVWNMNDPTDERLRFLSEHQDLFKDSINNESRSLL